MFSNEEAKPPPKHTWTKSGEGWHSLTLCCSNHRMFCDDSSDDEDDIPEIVDLQKALEYLVSERDIENIYNGYNFHISF